MKMPIDNYQWHEFFPNNGNNVFLYFYITLYTVDLASTNSHSSNATETHNVCIVIAIWAPIILVS